MDQLERVLAAVLADEQQLRGLVRNVMPKALLEDDGPKCLHSAVVGVEGQLAGRFEVKHERLLGGVEANCLLGHWWHRFRGFATCAGPLHRSSTPVGGDHCNCCNCYFSCCSRYYSLQLAVHTV